MKANNNSEIVLQLLFFVVRLATTFAAKGVETFMKLLKSFIQYVDRFGDEKSGNDLIEHIDQYLSLTSQLKNLWMSDIAYWKPKTFDQRIRADTHKGKVAVVTGADRDVGQCTALVLAQIGFKVFLIRVLCFVKTVCNQITGHSWSEKRRHD